MIYHVYFSDGGVPATGLTPAWEYLITGSVGTDKSGSAPAITEVGGGWYKFSVAYGTAPWDVVAEDLLGVIDGGSSLDGGERYKPVKLTLAQLALLRLTGLRKWDQADGDEHLYDVDLSTEILKFVRTEASSQDILTPTKV